jgi:hypothetical protein
MTISHKANINPFAHRLSFGTCPCPCPSLGYICCAKCQLPSCGVPSHLEGFRLTKAIYLKAALGGEVSACLVRRLFRGNYRWLTRKQWSPCPTGQVWEFWLRLFHQKLFQWRDSIRFTSLPGFSDPIQWIISHRLGFGFASLLLHYIPLYREAQIEL